MHEEDDCLDGAEMCTFVISLLSYATEYNVENVTCNYN